MPERWDRKLIAFEMLKLWSTNSMLMLKEKAWLALRDEEAPIDFHELQPEQRMAINAVINFFYRLRVLADQTSPNVMMADHELVLALFAGDAAFWVEQLNKIRASEDSHADVDLFNWYRDSIRPFLTELARARQP